MNYLNRIIIIIILATFTFSSYLNYRLSAEVLAGIKESYESFFCYSGQNKSDESKIYDELNRFNKYSKASLISFIFTLLAFFVISLILLNVNIQDKFIDYQKWWFPFALIIISWIQVITVYILFSLWGDNFFYHCFIDQAYIFSGYGFDNPGRLFRWGWRIKNLLLISSYFFYRKNQKMKVKKFNSLFVYIFFIDLVLGNLIVLILHDDIDHLNPFFDIEFNPAVGPL